MTSDSQLDRIITNCRAEYKMYIKRREFNTLRELIILAKDFECVRSDGDTPPRTYPRLQVAVADSRPPSICFRCAEPGHHRATCTNPQVMFCWICRKHGVRTIDCCQRSAGNASRDFSQPGQENL